MSNKLQQGTTSAGVFSVCPDRRFALSEGMDMDLVKKRKEELGLTNKDIAAALKIDVSAVSKLLSGKRQLKANEAQILADLLKIDAIGSPIIRQIPMIGKASAGAWKEAIHDPMGWMPCPDPSFPKGVFALFIDGDSIDKIAPDGATIIVDPSDKLLVDRALYLMMNGTGGATVKLFFSDPARLEPCSNNPEHQTIYPGEEPFFVIGRVIWEGRKLR